MPLTSSSNLPRLDRRAISVVDLHDDEGDRRYRFEKSPLERIEAVEMHRRMVCGEEFVASRMQKSFDVVELESLEESTEWKIRRKNSMKKRFIQTLLPLLVAALLLPGAGCGTAKKVYEKVNPIGGGSTDLKKRVLLLPILDQQGLDEEAVAQMTDRLAALLEEDRNLVVYRNEDPLPSSIEVRSPKYGIVIDPDMAQKAEELGMNVLVTCVLNRYEVIDHGAGLWPINQIPVWPFTRKSLELDVSMVVNALDITNGTLFLTHLASRRLEIPDPPVDEESLFVEEREPRTEIELIQAVPEAAMQKAFGRLLGEQAEVIAESLEDKVWAGRVLSAAPERIMINAGRDVGLSEGSVFEVFSRGDAVQSVSGRSLYLLGSKVGEIRTVKVMDQYSTAVPVSGESFRAGQVIREKP